ncbi:uncharacterized protein PFLUO_LOCUS8644 [Penicillium psychrofluorescens]|uniref:uncharacterized protein n=1 Tax=Penicillium psychrofluorescens TaxID=3158075 RepID=UPI003CCE0C24
MATAEKIRDQQKRFPMPNEDDYPSGDGDYESGDGSDKEEVPRQRNKRQRRWKLQDDVEEAYSNEEDDYPSDQYDDYSDYDDNNDDDDDYVMQGKAMKPYQQVNMVMEQSSGDFSPVPQRKNVEGDGLKLRLELNLDIEIELKARITGDLTLALL